MIEGIRAIKDSKAPQDVTSEPIPTIDFDYNQAIDRLWDNRSVFIEPFNPFRCYLFHTNLTLITLDCLSNQNTYYQEIYRCYQDNLVIQNLKIQVQSTVERESNFNERGTIVYALLVVNDGSSVLNLRYSKDINPNPELPPLPNSMDTPIYPIEPRNLYSNACCTTDSKQWNYFDNQIFKNGQYPGPLILNQGDRLMLGAVLQSKTQSIGHLRGIISWDYNILPNVI